MPKFLEVTNKTAARAAINAAGVGTDGKLLPAQAKAPGAVWVSEADATGATDCLATLQGIINAASAGDTIYLPGGTFKISAELVINKPLVIRGGGGMFTASNQGGTFPGSAGTTIVTSSATANGLNITASGVVIEDLAVVNTRSNASKPTAGTGIMMNNANNFRLSRVTVAGFYDCVRIEGRFGTMDSCNIFDPVRYGIFAFNDNTTAWGPEMDFGDQGISNCVIAMYGRQTHNADAAIRWESGGGIRFTGNKIVAGTGPGAANIGYFKYGVDLVTSGGYASGEFMIVGGGISTCTEACIRAVCTDSISGFTDMTVTGVVLQGQTGSKGIIVGAADTNGKNNIRNVIITGNTFKGNQGGGIVAHNMRGLVVGPNVWASESYTAPLITLAGTSVSGTDNGVSTQQVDIHRQTVCSSVQDINLTLVNDKRGIANQGSLDGFVNYNYKRTVYTNTTGWKTLFTIEPPDQGGAGFVDVTLSGQDFGVGWFTKKIRRSFLKNNSTVGGAISVATVGTDESAGSTTYVGLQVVDGGSGKLLVQVAMLAGGATVWGDIEVNTSGRVQKFSYGAGV